MKFLLKRIIDCSFKYIAPSIEIYTDGSHKDGIGSWAFVVTKKGKVVAESSGRVRRASSNSMEFRAAVEALGSISKASKVKLFSDSKILVDAMLLWRGPKSFQTEIEQLKVFGNKHRIYWHWIKAHSGNQFNERCDELCMLARKQNVSK